MWFVALKNGWGCAESMLKVDVGGEGEANKKLD